MKNGKIMKRVIRYSIFGVLTITLLLAAILFYFSYKTSIPVAELVQDSPNLISSAIQNEEIDGEYIENYASADQKVLDAVHYDLNIDLYPGMKIIKGDATIKLVTKGLQKIDLNLYDNFEIKSVKLNGSQAKYENKDTRFTIFPAEKLTDTSIVEIVYEGKPKSMGFGSFSFGEKNGKSFIYTMNEPVFASTWFPCNDIPRDKALFDIKISNDSSDVSVSNGNLVSVSANGARKTYHWKTVYPIATYLVAIYSAEYKNYNEEYTSSSKIKMPVTYYVTPEKFESARHDFFIHPEAIGIFSKLFGEYPFIKEKYGVAEFLWNKGALENQTITGIGTVFISGMGIQKDLLVHELAHSWWGNAVGLGDWKDIWLNEGFANYSVALYYEALTDRRALVSTMRSYLGRFEKAKGTLYNPVQDIFSTLVYDKGAWVLHMLRREVGDSSFFRILRKYYNDFKYKTAVTKDFQNECESVSKKKLDYFFKQWVFDGTGIIEADYSYSAAKAGGNEYTVSFDIEQTQKGYTAYSFPLDLKFIAPDGNYIIKTVYIRERNSHFELKLGFQPQDMIPDPDLWLLAKLKKK
jgi:aminopeptidase N